MIKNKETKLDIKAFAELKRKGNKITMLTAYDYSMAANLANTDIDLILVGDSLGMVVLGYENTLKVSIEDMIYHSAAVRRGAPNKFIVTDMPYMSYHLDIKSTKQNAAKLITQGLANAVKLEGGSGSRLEAIAAIVDCEIPVCAHLGLTPQSIHRFGGYKVQGKSVPEHELLIKQAIETEKAGAFMLVLEGIPERLGKQITEAVSIPTIGIGAGRFTDGQVLVYHDLLGMGKSGFKFVKQYAAIDRIIVQSISQYSSEVRSGAFPNLENVYYPIDENK